jgi:hypothetical protein
MWMTMMMVDGWMCSGHSREEGGRQRGDEYKIFRYIGRLCVRPVFDICASLLLLLFACLTCTRLGPGCTREYIWGCMDMVRGVMDVWAMLVLNTLKWTSRYWGIHAFGLTCADTLITSTILVQWSKLMYRGQILRNTHQFLQPNERTCLASYYILNQSQCSH